MSAWEGLNPPYATIVADPPWEYDEGFVQGTSRGVGRLDIDLPYSSMPPLAEIEALRLNPGEKVLANMENEALFEAVVISATSLGDRDLATIRLGDPVPRSDWHLGAAD